MDGGTQKRAFRACDSCYKRKIKCDAVKPQCNWCRHHEIPCTFSRARGRRKKQDLNRHGHLDQRIARIESILLQHPKSADAGSNASNAIPLKQGLSHPDIGLLSHEDSDKDAARDVRTLIPNLCQVRFAGRSLGSINSYSGIPVFSPRGLQWLQSRTGEIATSEKLCSLGLPWLNSDRAAGLESLYLSSCASRPDTQLDLPDREAVRKCARAYNFSGLSLVFPILEMRLLEETIRLAYDSPATPYSPYAQCAKAFIFSFLAFVSSANIVSDALSGIDIDGCALEAHRLIPHIVEGPPNMDGLCCMLMLSIYKAHCGDFKSVDMLLSVSSRLIFTLGGHVWPPPEFTGDRTPGTSPHAFTPSVAQSHLRTLFWICYINDKELSLRTGRPPSMNDYECDLSPADKEDIERVSPESMTGLGSIDSCFLSHVRLSVIKSRTYTLLYSARALRKTDAELLHDIRELDDDLEKWRVSLLPEYRPSASPPQEPASRFGDEIRAIILRLEYHHCMATIHQASSRCQAWMENAGGVMEGVSSSLELAVEASRSSLLHLHRARSAIVHHCFWFVIFFPISALLTIFCNILQNPLHPHHAKDLELLKEAPGIVREALSDQKHTHDVKNIKSIEELMTLMGKLANSAIEKATRESSDRSDSIRMFAE